MSYKFIDLFCGAGGFSKGLELAGFECIGGIELKEVIAKTHQLNHKHSKTIFGDIREIPPEKFAETIGTNHVDVIIGGPPCPTFSTIGDAKIRSVTGKPVSEDPRNQLFLEYLKYVDYFRPEIFVIENVPNFITKYKGKIFNTAVEIIESIGKDEDGNGEGIYEVVKPVQVVNAVYYGVPQTRRRMMLVAHKKTDKKFNYPKPTHYYDQTDEESKKLKPCTTVEDAIGDLPKITDNWRITEMPYSKVDRLTEYQKLMRSYGNGKTVMNNICRMSNDRAKRVFPHMAQGSIYMDLSPEIRQILPFREDIFKDRLKRLVMKEPSWTVIAHIGMDGYMYIHPTENRTLSVREAARIQSFPDDFEFVGNQQETYVQVGNAVPPLLGKAIGESIKQYLEG
ncbi:MAG: DNA cytosine methyltransferase [Butyrivibrio sp.]|uniref:DNA cytosine methyltransferase n=1 Tax=Butyrivibrio sp. TaxID=28121 RepID=UPI001B2D310B|nr:DNA cytosine methyltransferase [Butyrivibrio sp.]MBO6240377.1 DNA cytosine methyltransferase [Butyrivibrio sp.]